MITPEQAMQCLEAADINRRVDDWLYDTEFTAEVPSFMYALTGILYLKLEKQGLIPKFSQHIDKNEWGEVGKGFVWDADVGMCRVAIQTALKENGWVFPSEYCFVPEDCSGPIYDCFWTEDLHDLDPDFCVEFLNSMGDSYGFSLDEEQDAVDDADEVTDEAADEEKRADTVTRYIAKFEKECGVDMVAFVIYNPHWHEITDRFLSIKEPSKVLTEKFELLERDIQKMESSCFMSDSTYAYLPNGHRAVANFVYPFIDSDGYGEAMHLNPLLYLSLSTPLEAVRLRKEMDALDVLIRAEMK